jgi:hypothetical protein
MSIICSLITKNFAIIKGDTKGTHGNIILNITKVLQLVRGKKTFLIGFAGAMNYDHKPIRQRIITDLKEKMFQLYDNTQTVVNEMEIYFNEGIKNAPDIKGGNESIALNIISKRDYQLGEPKIYSIFIDYRNGSSQHFYWNKEIDQTKGWDFAKEGENIVQNELDNFFENEGKHFDPNDLKNSCDNMEIGMKKAIAKSTGSCGLPTRAICFLNK